MALSKLQKGLVGLGIAVVAVIAVGYGGMRYLENAVVDAIRTWAAQTPQDAHVELGDISYTLMDNHLVLKNVRMTYVTPAKQTVAATVETLDIRNPGTTLLSLMRDPKSEIKEAELPVADEIALHNLSFGPEPNITVRLRTFKGVAIETAAVKTLMSTAGDDDPKVALAIIYGLSYKEDSASGVKITCKALLCQRPSGLFRDKRDRVHPEGAGRPDARRNPAREHEPAAPRHHGENLLHRSHRHQRR